MRIAYAAVGAEAMADHATAQRASKLLFAPICEELEERLGSGTGQVGLVLSFSFVAAVVVVVVVVVAVVVVPLPLSPFSPSPPLHPLHPHSIPSTPTSQQLALIACVERHLGVELPEKSVIAPLIIKAMYDEDVLEEEAILEWHAGSNDSCEYKGEEDERFELLRLPGVGEAEAAMVKAKATPFVQWLKEADESDSDGDDDDDDDDDEDDDEEEDDD